MSLRGFGPILWIAVYLIGLELALEWRAHSRGWETLVFGLRAEPAAPAGTTGPARAGPTEEFPFRSRIVENQRSADEVRIWIASSSHAEDERVPVDEVFPAALDKCLNELGIAAQVLNASNAGATVRSHVARATSDAPEWKPDIVVLYQMSNDVNGLCKAAAGEQVLEGPGDQEAARQSSIADVIGFNASLLVERTTTFELVKTNLTSRLIPSRVLHDSLEPADEDIFLAAVREFVDVWRVAGVRPVLMTFATSHDRSDLPSFPHATTSSIFRFNPHLSLEGWVGTVERLNEGLRRIAREEGVLLVELESAVGGRSELFRDFVHFTPAGHREVGRILCEGLAGLAREVERSR